MEKIKKGMNSQEKLCIHLKNANEIIKSGVEIQSMGVLSQVDTLLGQLAGSLENCDKALIEKAFPEIGRVIS